ncbi:ABC transporter ATP-binding protein [Afifella sp. H1R]|uniref:ABC transporter ATP-binding protein n=1 Tax=Afifella sp. H1R TaxID=2908841 RepID=UPI001F43ED13|nr:ABC transporter ATP-binding protein [Afifella sp. H1R]MCF1504297.1 ABC transporter ATP-binding protein [Afifella sp. H1R]
MVGVALKQVKKSYGNHEVLHGIDLNIDPGEFIVFVGPSGCGKSTLLRVIAGLEEMTSGELRIGGRLMNDVPPAKRGIAMVFQSYALYPHMTVYDNMAFSMKIAREKKAKIDARVRQAAEILQLTPYLNRLPKALSGGQRQRVAIGRAIVRNSEVFLFDEPLSNLDAALRVATRIEVAKLKESLPDTTMIYVTHDQVEAMTLADRIVVLRDGCIEQVGTPEELYREPTNLFVAQFIGSPAMNLVRAQIEKPGPKTLIAYANGTRMQVPVPTPASAKGAAVDIGVRPEELRITEGEHLFEGIVDYAEYLGEVQLVYFKTEDDAHPVIAKLPGNVHVERGARLKLGADVGSLHVFDAEGRAFRGKDAPEGEGAVRPSVMAPHC